MELNEIRELSNEELGNCLVERFNLVRERDGADIYTRSRHGGRIPISGLCTSLDAVAEVEKIVIEKGLDRWYVVHLVSVTGGKIMKDVLSEHNGYITKDWALNAFCATARQRAEACLLALQSTN